MRNELEANMASVDPTPQATAVATAATELRPALRIRARLETFFDDAWQSGASNRCTCQARD